MVWCVFIKSNSVLVVFTGAMEAGLQHLAAMGYEEQAAASALSASGGDVPAAVEMLSK
jgi:hypothetical protein